MAPIRRLPDFKPHNYPRNLVVYTGTHDNDTTVGWWTSAIGHSTRSATDIADEREHATRYLGLEGREVHWEFIRAVMASVADTAIVPAQDLLGLGSEARMNRPGTADGNWRWRLRPGQLTQDTMRRLGVLADTYDRASVVVPERAYTPPQRNFRGEQAVARPSKSKVDRRGFLKGAGAAGAAALKFPAAAGGAGVTLPEAQRDPPLT